VYFFLGLNISSVFPYGITMKFVFVCIHIQRSSRAIPLGAASVAANVKKHFPTEVDVEIVDCYLPDSPAVHIEKIAAHNPDSLGLSIYLWNREASLDIAASIKEDFPTCTIFVGGSEPSARPEFYAENPNIDFVMNGESEEIIIPIIHQLLNISKTPAAKQIAGLGGPDLDKLPSPYLEGTLPLENYTGVLWELSRGCPFKCAFCFESRGHSSIRRFSESRILAELELFKQADISEIFILDPTFNYHKEQAKKLLGLLADKAPEIHYSMEIRAEFLDEELADRFADIFCTLQIGLQSIHPKVLKKINRTYNQEIFTEKVFLLHEANVAYGFDLIYGLPEDTLSGFLESLDYSFTLAPNHLDIFPLAILPGTELFYQADSYNINYSSANSWIVTSTPDFSEADMDKAGKIATAVDLFYNQGKAVSWFDIILPNMNLQPSEFFTLAAEYLLEEIATADPFAFQNEVITKIFSQLNISDITDTALDLMKYFKVTNNLSHNHTDPSGTHILTEKLQLNDSTAVESFTYNPLDIISLCEQGITQLADIMDLCDAEEPFLAFYIEESEFAVYFASFEEYEFLQAALIGDSNKISAYIENPDNQESLENMLKADILKPVQSI
jgi:radical SAM superfamily enzyme YgiQ (UPF0313 family)